MCAFTSHGEALAKGLKMMGKIEVWGYCYGGKCKLPEILEIFHVLDRTSNDQLRKGRFGKHLRSWEEPSNERNALQQNLS